MSDTSPVRNDLVDPDERPFVEAIVANPNDDELRLVYADWLEEHGDERAEWLRAEIVMRRLRNWSPDHRLTRKRIRELQQRLDVGWCATLARAPVWNCGYPDRLEVIDGSCGERWEQCGRLDEPLVRHCVECDSNVFYCRTIHEARERADAPACLALDPTISANPWQLNRRYWTNTLD